MKLSSYDLDFTKDSFAFQQAGFPDSKRGTEALTRGGYVEFTFTPKPGTSVSITSLTFAPYWQALEQATPGGGNALSIADGPINVIAQTDDSSIPRLLTATFSRVSFEIDAPAAEPHPSG